MAVDGAERLFFAMQPSLAVREELHQRAVALGVGRPTPVDNIHLTLRFLGACDAVQRQRAEQIGTALPPPETWIRTGCLAHWAGARAVVLLVEPLDDELPRLQQALAAALDQAGFPPDRRPFRPHLTLLRKVPSMGSLPRIPPQSLSLAGFGLFRSQPGARGAVYERLRYWATKAPV